MKFTQIIYFDRGILAFPLSWAVKIVSEIIHDNFKLFLNEVQMNEIVKDLI